MSFKKDNNNEEKILNNEDFEEIQEELKEIEEQENLIEEENISDNKQINDLKEALARKQADYENFKKRVERDREDMIYFMKSDILKKTLPWIDNMERIIKNTPENLQNWALYEGIKALEKQAKNDLEKMWVKTFDSKWTEVDPNKHEVMTQIPGEEWIIVDEFEKWYLLWDKVLRVAKVIVWNWN